MEYVNDMCVDLKSLQIETDDKPSLSSIQSGGNTIINLFSFPPETYFILYKIDTESPSIKDIQRESEDLPSLGYIQSNESLDTSSGSSVHESNTRQTILSRSMSCSRPGQEEGEKIVIMKNCGKGEQLTRKSSFPNSQQRKSIFRRSSKLWKSLDNDPK